jgi:hypothetical protein
MDLWNGLVGYWPLDRQSYDQVTHRFVDKSVEGNHSTGNGDNLGDTFDFEINHYGIGSGATPFDGSSDFINCGNDAIFNFGTDSFSISFWLKSDPANYDRVIGKQGDPNSYWDCFNSGDDNRMRWRLRGDAATQVVQSQPEVVFDNEWHHAVWIIDRTEDEVVWYFNGVKSATVYDISSLSGLNFDSTSIIRIGQADVGHNIRGTLNNVRIYDRVLSEDESMYLYLERRYFYEPFVPLRILEKLVRISKERSLKV